MTSKKAALSSGLVAIKGRGEPAPDMPSRTAEAVATPPAPASQRREKGKGEELVPLNFRIGASFRREFKTYAAQHDLKLNELLRRCFASYRQEHGD